MGRVRFVAGLAGQPGAEIRQRLWRAQHPNGPAGPTWGAPPGQRFFLVAHVYNRGGAGTGLDVSLGGPAIESGQVTVHSLDVGTGLESHVAVPTPEGDAGPLRLRARLPSFSIAPKPGVEGGADYDTEATFLTNLAGTMTGTAHQLTPRIHCESNGHFKTPLPIEVVVAAIGLPESECRQDVLVEDLAETSVTDA